MTTFSHLHDGPLPLLLPNAWDLASALAYVAEGFPAIGTTSFGVASALGRPDGSRATSEANMRLADQLRPLSVFVSVDIEDGYSDAPDVVASYVAGLAVDGINIEDSANGRLVDPAAVAAKVAAIKSGNPDVFVNARVDSYWVHEDESAEAALARAATYVDAGADGVFLPGLSEPEPLRVITGSLDVPSTCWPSPAARWPSWLTSVSGGSAPDHSPTAPRLRLRSVPPPRSETASTRPRQRRTNPCRNVSPRTPRARPNPDLFRQTDRSGAWTSTSSPCARTRALRRSP